MSNYTPTETERKEPRFHCFMYVTYEDPAYYSQLFDGMSNYAFIKHDNPEDLRKDDGDEKQIHWHILIYYKNARTLSSCINKCIRYKQKRGQTVRVERAYDTFKAFLYLTHTDPDSHSKNKVPYPDDNIVSYDISWWNNQSEADSSGFTMHQFITDLFTLSPLQMALHYGRDYIKNCTRYTTFKTEIINAYDGDIDAILEEVNGLSGNQFFELITDADL